MSRKRTFSRAYIAGIIKRASQSKVQAIGPGTLMEKYYDPSTGEAIMRVTCRLPGAAVGLPVNTILEPAE